MKVVEQYLFADDVTGGLFRPDHNINLDTPVGLVD